ncbi:gp16 family protein [Erythrobacter sp. WG]|uniref:gp16 family protein n=1 Tax=Erythrobacter sp. WG TaxID=2985510 RepID=UPI00226F24DE|nr:regulatory protein GemA [Erythrobacter sp. WG]MCX9146596.1 regulatory protein GemA [Erythrobacter sp. WG]
MTLALHTNAAPARFDRSASHRRAMLAKIHVAKKELQLADDDYRQILLDSAGRTSAGDCTEAELERVLKRLQEIGFTPLTKAGAARPAQHPMARKARALWISLHHLGAVEKPSEQALEAFARRQLKCERLVWADQSQGYRLIEALKAMAERHGWPQVDPAGRPWSLLKLKELLCEAILAKLKARDIVPADWTLDTAAFRLCGIEPGAEGPITAEGYDAIASALGQKLRAAGGVK